MPDVRRRIQLLLVEDSILFRKTLERELSRDSGFAIVATASDPFEARDRIMEFNPDAMILDINLPRMNGVEFIRRLMAQYPIPIIAISSNRELIAQAIREGAFNGVEKPARGRGMNLFVRDLSEKIRFHIGQPDTAAKAGTESCAHARHKAACGPEQDRDAPEAGRALDGEPAQHRKSKKIVIAIGASTGGTDAIAYILSALPAGLPGIIIVQHMPADFTSMFARRLDNICAFSVSEAKTGSRILPGTALVAPGSLHLRMVRNSDVYSTLAQYGEKVSGHCPSVDVMFNSVADTAGSRAIGVLLTGMGNDGAEGLLKMRIAGAATIGQDSKSCVVYGMPKVAYEMGAVAYQLPLHKIASKIIDLL